MQFKIWKRVHILTTALKFKTLTKLQKNTKSERRKMKEKEKVEKWGKYDELLSNEGKLWFAVSY